MLFSKRVLTAAVLAMMAWRAGAQDAATQERIARVERCLPGPVVVKGEAVACPTLLERMKELHVTGLSVAVVHDGTVEWAKGYGVVAVGGAPVTAETMFQAGSISKPVASMAALRLVQQGKLTLDADVNTELKSWKVPASAAAPGATVTLRELMTHTAGMTVHGFPGYAAGEPVPTVVQVLDGVKPANTPAVRVETVPGTTWNYSGGGMTVMQLMMVEASGEAFPKLLKETVLGPIGMTHSTYEQPLPEGMRAMAATPYNADGTPVAGGAHTYPEMVAAGLWTTPTDLAKYILENQRSLEGKANHVLSVEMTKQMLTEGMGHWGLGVEMGGSAENPYFTHGGVNEGFESLFVGYEKGGTGAVVMTNAEGGERIAEEVMRAVAAAYGWPDFKPVERAEVKVGAAVLGKYVGTYEMSPGHDFTFTVEGGRLMGETNGQKLPLYAESDSKFFLKVVDAEMEFVMDSAGRAVSLMVEQGGKTFKAARTK